MKLKLIGRAGTASMLSLAMALGVTSCSNDYTVSYVYMATSKALPHGLINGYQVDYQSGSLLPLADSPIDAGGRDTVALVVAPNDLFLYTVNNFDSNVVELAIGTDGKLYPQHTYSTTGSLPTAAAIDAAGKFLYVTFTYQNNQPTASNPYGSELYTPANPGPGGITIFPINSDNTLGTPVSMLNGSVTTVQYAGLNDVPVGRNPVGITTVKNSSDSYVYVIEQDSAVTTNLIGFKEDPTTGALTALAGETINSGNVPSTGFASGTMPSGILADSTGTHLYVTDQTLNQVWAYSLASSGVPTLIGTTQTDAGPLGMTFDLSGKFLYVTAYSANVLDGYTLSASGQPVRSTTTSTMVTGTGPTCAAVVGAPTSASPSHGEYLYTSNQLGGSVTGLQLNQQDGSLVQIPGTPYSGSALATCLVTVPAFPLR